MGIEMKKRNLMQKYKWNLLGQIIVFGVLIVGMLIWEPLVLKVVFQVIELQEENHLLFCGGVIGIGILFLFLIGYLNNTYIDMDRWKIIYAECEEALKTLPTLSYDDINRHFSEGGIFERIFSIGQARMGIFFSGAGIGIYVLAGGLLLGNVWTAGVLLIAVATGMMAIQFILLWARSRMTVKYENKYRQAEEETNSRGSHMINDLPFILMNCLEEEEIGNFVTIRRETFGVLKKQKVWEAFFLAADTCLTMIVKALLALWMFPLALGSGLITAVFAVIDKLKMVLGAVAENFIGISKMKVAVRRYGEMEAFAKQEAEGTEQSRDLRKKETLVTLSDAGIRVEDKVIFENMNIEIKAGEKVAVVGPNGCGKSSVLKVLAGLYHLTEGDFRKNKECRIAYIPAKATLFTGTGMENIQMAYKKEDGDGRKPEFWFCKDFEEQQITNMSGGQQQRINIARGIYGNAELLLADEPTSHLDPEASREVMKHLVENVNTCVVITHDKNLLGLFDRVIELGKQR